MKFGSDIDIDVADRSKVLEHIKVTPAAIRAAGSVKKHNTGVYPTAIPADPITGLCTIDYAEAEDRGYVKVDLLNVWVYSHVRSEDHLKELMVEPDWSMLESKETFSKLIHIGRHWNSARAMQEPVNSIPRLAMFLAVIRPSKRHLIGLPWAEVAREVWQVPPDGGYYFKKAHAVSYAVLVAVHMNLLASNPQAFSLSG